MTTRVRPSASRSLRTRLLLPMAGATALACGAPPAEIARTTSALTTTGADAVSALSPPSIDGAMDEVWNDTPAYGASRVVGGASSGAGDLSATWRARWDADALYLLVRVADESLRNDSGNPWEDDSVEIYLDGDDSKASSYTADDYQLVIGWNDVNVVEAHGKSVPNVVFAKQDVPGGYQMEIRVPWTSVNAQPAISWRTIGLDVHVNDDDDGGRRDGKVAWNSDFDSSWTDPRTFGALRLLPKGLPTCPPAEPGDYIDVDRARVSPVVDGREDPSGAWGWSSIGYLTSPIGGTISSSSDLSGEWKIAWDANHLYVLATIDDDVRANDSANPWDDDSLEVYLDGDDSKATSYTADDYQLVFGWNDGRVVEAHGKSVAGITFAKTDTATGYRIEARIPWSSINATPPTVGRRLGVDVHVNDDDDGGARDGKLAFSARVDQAWANPSLFYTARLRGACSE